jgi:hypothetical protein
MSFHSGPTLARSTRTELAVFGWRMSLLLIILTLFGLSAGIILLRYCSNNDQVCAVLRSADRR